MDGAGGLPVAEHQVANPWSSVSPLTPSSDVWDLSVTATWSLSWPGRCYRPPSTHLLLLRHPPHRPSWSRPPQRGASVAPQTAASGVWVMGHDPSCSSWIVGWSGRCRSSMEHREKSCGHWSGLGRWQMEDRVIQTRREKNNYKRNCALEVLILCLSTQEMFFHAYNQADLYCLGLTWAGLNWDSHRQTGADVEKWAYFLRSLSRQSVCQKKSGRDSSK